MTKRIFQSTLKTYQLRQPFAPFFVEFVNGTVLEVRHPEGLVGQGGSAVYMHRKGAMTIFDVSGVIRFSDHPERNASA